MYFFAKIQIAQIVDNWMGIERVLVEPPQDQTVIIVRIYIEF